jgi:hypothetical protein
MLISGAGDMETDGALEGEKSWAIRKVLVRSTARINLELRCNMVISGCS